MEEEKLNKSNTAVANTSKHVNFTSKSGESTTEINPLASTCSIRPKKSYSLLSALVRRTKLKTKKNEVKSNNLKFITSNSTIGSHSTEEFELTLQKVENRNGANVKETKIRRTELSDSEQSMPSSIKTKRRFFSKFLKKHVLSDANNKKKSSNVYAIEGNPIMDQSISELKDTLEKANQNKSIQLIPTSFIQLDKPNITSTLTQGLIAVQNLASRLQQSEGHLMNIFTKYITDISLQKELVDTLCLHSKLHLETERMNNVLSMEMWLKQIEIEKVQETALQEALNSVIRQNRQLQSEYELLFCTYERLLKKFKNFNEREVGPRSIVGFDPQIQDIIKHNIKLTHKMELLYEQIERLENELSKFRKQNESLEHQLSNSIVQCHDVEALFQRTNADYELEKANLNHQLKSKEKILVNAIDACTKLKKDLDGTEDELKRISLNVDWNKLKCHEDSLIDFIDLTRICIIDLSKELTTLRKQLCLKDKEIDMLLDTNGKLQENLKRSTTELDGLTKKIDDSDKLLAEHRYKCLETDLKLNHEKMERLKLDHELEKNKLLHKINEFENLNNEKISIIEQSNAYISNLNTDNVSLRNQVDNLNRLLRDAGSGDIVKELSMNQERILKLDYQCNQLIGEKQQLLNQLEFLREDYKKISECQHTTGEQVKSLQIQIETMTKENRQLQQNYEAERHTVVSLQAERKKYLDEKALIKTFFHHMKSEITRLQKLEGTVTDISKEANKLAMVADYNKQLGKKLKLELEEKDKTIFKLRSSVDKLNDIQLKTTQEKMSLCHELSELCQIKEKLNSELSWEVQKNLALDDAKHEIAESANTQLQQYEEFHRRERSLLKDLLKDLKCVVKERNNLLSDKEHNIQEIDFLNITKTKLEDKIVNQTKQIEDYQKQIDEYRKQVKELRKKVDEQITKLKEFEREKEDNEEKFRELEEEQEEDKVKINKLQDKLLEELKNYDENVKQMENIIFELRKEKEHMEDSIKYLQNNTQKLHNDLNNSRSNEKDLKDALNQCLSENSSLEDDIHSKQIQIDALNLDKDKLTNEINKVNLVSEKILTDFENNINSSIKKEELFKQELRESQNALINVSTENELLTKELSDIKEEFEKVNQEFNNLKEQEHKWTELIQSFESKKDTFKDILNQKEKLEHEYTSLQNEYKITKDDVYAARNECESLFRQMAIVVEQKKVEISNLQREIDDIIKNNQDTLNIKVKEINQLQSNITELNQQLENERSSYTALSQIHKEISTKFIKSIKDIVDVKNSKQDIERKFRESNEYLEKLKIEKSELQEEVNVLLNGLEDNKNRIKTLTLEKENCQNLLTDLQKKYNDVLAQCMLLEDQIREIQLSSDSDSEEIKLLQKENDRMKKDSEETHKIIMSLQKEIGQLQQQITGLEFQKSECTLRLHELRRKFETEQSLCQQLKSIQKILLSRILKMKDDGIMNQEQCNCLINLIKNVSTTDFDDEDADIS